MVKYPPRSCGHTGTMYGCKRCERYNTIYPPRPCRHSGVVYNCSYCEITAPGAAEMFSAHKCSGMSQHYPPPPVPAYEPSAPPPISPDSYPTYPSSYPPAYPTTGPRPCGHTGIMYGCTHCEGSR
ncbi:unnamed protein product [Acanthoscelides obtectus]|uniref:Uncharacterized protein n=1 Tax=Acanthoscelides obtectus TaxID=200917 RepID=A0A9P0QAC8_ACAOB|nr:unnamed protein product [Acanthoscelides obtectus]CAK1666763.1 hypothetical protein AOBTE_LOCUS25473 [Acanthoscelides obtectus]